MRRLSAESLSFAESAVGPLARTRFCGWDHADSDVWELIGVGGSRFFLKVHKRQRKFDQERHAYGTWTPAMAGRCPDVLAIGERMLLLSALPGRLACEREPTLEMYRAAGAFLRDFHDLPHLDEDRMPLDEALDRRCTAWVERARSYLGPGELDFVRREIAAACPALTDEPRVPCHLDFTPRNWIVDDEGCLGVIDFEHARPNGRWFDICRLQLLVFFERPDLEAAFWAGYRHLPGAGEQALLRQLASLEALSTLTWACDHGDAAFEAMGRDGLLRLMDAG